MHAIRQDIKMIWKPNIKWKDIDTYVKSKNMKLKIL